MSEENKCCEATPHGTLLEQILNSNYAKSEREWAAAKEIERLQAETGLYRTALEKIKFSEVSRATLPLILIANGALLQSERK